MLSFCGSILFCGGQIGVFVDVFGASLLSPVSPSAALLAENRHTSFKNGDLEIPKRNH